MPEKKAEELALLAYLYAGGELPTVEATAFERQLAEDQGAREALAEAVWMSAVLRGGEPRPKPTYREKVRARLRPVWWRRLLGRRTYRGHPVLWSAVGAAAASLCLLLTRPAPAVLQNEPNVQTSNEPDDGDEPMTGDMAQIWAELQNSDHAVKAATQEHKRKTRMEDRRQNRKPAASGSTH